MNLTINITAPAGAWSVAYQFALAHPMLTVASLGFVVTLAAGGGAFWYVIQPQVFFRELWPRLVDRICPTSPPPSPRDRARVRRRRRGQ